MTPAARILLSVVCASLIVFALARVCPEDYEAALYWSLPIFHKVAPPLHSGPNPYAALYALVTNTAILALPLFLLLGRVRRRFSLRTMLIVTTLVAIGLGIVAVSS